MGLVNLLFTSYMGQNYIGNLDLTTFKRRQYLPEAEITLHLGGTDMNLVATLLYRCLMLG